MVASDMPLIYVIHLGALRADEEGGEGTEACVL